MSPAELLRIALLAQSIVASPAINPIPRWACFIGNMPESLPGQPINDAVAIYDSGGHGYNRAMDATQFIHPKFQVKVRSANYTDGYAKVGEIAYYLDRIIRLDVNGDGTYILDAVHRLPHMHIGFENSSKRHMWVLNGTVALANSGRA